MENVSTLRFIQALITLLVLVLVILQNRWWWLRTPGISVGSVLLVFCAFQLLFRFHDGFGITILFGATAIIVSFFAIGFAAYKFSGEKTLVQLSIEILIAIFLTILFVGCSSDFILGLLFRIQGTRTIP